MMSRNCLICMLLLSGLFGFGCVDQKVFYQDNKEIENQQWSRSDTVTFLVDIAQNNKPLDWLCNIRYTTRFPVYNFYMQYSLVDSFNQVILTNLKQYVLFDPKRGHPIGAGNGGVFDLVVPLELGYQLNDLGRYKLNIVHYMRQDPIEGIGAIGLKIAESQPTTENK